MDPKLIYGKIHGYLIAHGKILTPRGKIVYTKVEELIRPITGIWDEELVRGIIFTIDANRILSIPISPHGMEDFVAWRHYKNSLFSVR
jgi:hypothetical protein